MKKHDLQFEEFASDVLRGDESDYVEVPVSPRMFLLVGFAAVVIIGVMISRVVTLNVAQREFYQARAATNVNHEKPIPAHRGIITDRYGAVLAKNTDTFSVYVNAGQLLKDREQLTGVLNRLSEALNAPVEDLEKAVASGDYENSAEVPVIRNITSEAAIAVRGLQLASVTVENDFRREYPNGQYFASVLGYTGTSDTSAVVVGKAGLERYYDPQLRGTDGVYVYHRDAKGATLDEQVAVESKAGEKIVTTIDGELQEYFYKRLSEGLRFLGVKVGVGIAMDPRTGEVLALVSLPSYDNNVFVTPGKSAERSKLVLDRDRRPLFNRAVSGAYNPGSTIKPLVALAALHEKVVTPQTTVYSAGYIDVPNPYVPDKPTRFVEFNMHEYGWVDVRSALAKSSNVYFYTVGGGFGNIAGLGIERLHHYWEKFGLGQKTGIGLEPEAAGTLPTAAEKEERTHQPWRLGDTFNVSIGQGDLLISPMQLINFFASVANNGVMNRPRLVHAIGDDQPVDAEIVLDYSDWKTELREVQMGMRDGVAKPYGTAYTLHDLPMTVAAKTGSAQTQNNTKTNALFVGYAPFDKPEIVVEILIENAKEGSLNAVPIAKDVFNWYYENRMTTAPSPAP